MCLVRFVAEGVGPFERLDLDLSDGQGNPHLGPHILAGVNGSGKSTALRAVAWTLEREDSGFPRAAWNHLRRVPDHSFSLLLFREVSGRLSGYSRVQRGRDFTATYPEIEKIPPPGWWIDKGEGQFALEGSKEPLVAAYAPSRSLQYLDRPDMNRTRTSLLQGALSFETGVDNEIVQAWLVGLFAKRALAKEQGSSGEEYESSRRRCEQALRQIFDEDVILDIERDPLLQPRLRIRGQRLNFSQIPDGVRTIVGWLADFMMRQDLAASQGLDGRGIILIDEIDAHLHPRWQRQILPALREALPDVQIIVASHSPFVISSCAGARVHVLEVDGRGRAHAKPPMDAPFGQSINATLKDIFGVESRFDLQTEKELAEWDDLRKREAVGRLSVADKGRLHQLTEELSSRSEELRSMVGPLPGLSPELIQSLTRGKRVGKR